MGVNSRQPLLDVSSYSRQRSFTNMMSNCPSQLLSSLNNNRKEFLFQNAGGTRDSHGREIHQQGCRTSQVWRKCSQVSSLDQKSDCGLQCKSVQHSRGVQRKRIEGIPVRLWKHQE